MDKVSLDPGHGGVDPGAVGQAGTQEKTINLAIARHVANYLIDSDVDVILTRNSDIGISLQDRCAIVNRSGAACFVSIHCNADENRNVYGAETYYHDKSTKGKQLAEYVQKQITSLGLYNRGVKSDYSLYPTGLYVLRETTMPAALVEIAFVSNSGEEVWLSNANNQDAAGKAIAKGVCEYLCIPFLEVVKPEKSFPDSDRSSGSYGGYNSDWSWAAEAINKLAQRARFNTPHDPGKPVTVGLLAIILERLRLI